MGEREIMCVVGAMSCKGILAWNIDGRDLKVVVVYKVSIGPSLNEQGGAMRSKKCHMVVKPH